MGIDHLRFTVCRHVFGVHSKGRHPVTSILEKNGYRIEEIVDGALDLSAADVILALGSINWFPKLWKQLSATPKQARPMVVVWHSEPLPPPKAAGLPLPRLHMREIARILLRVTGATDVYSNYSRIRSLARKGLPDLLIVSTLGRREFLAERGISAQWVPLGYEPRDGSDLGLARDVDVVFLGDLEIPRRQRLIRYLQQRGIKLLAVGDWHDPAYWGENRTRLLNRTKILLNLQRYPGELSGKRLIFGMANKALLISEPMYNPAPFVSGKHYVTVCIDEMPEAIRYYLEREDDRQRIVEEGYRFVTQELTMERSVSQILDLIKKSYA